MTVDPTPSVRPGRPATHAIRAMARPPSPPSRSPPVPQAPPTRPRPPHPGADRIDHAATHRDHRPTRRRSRADPGRATGPSVTTFRSRSPCRTAGTTSGWGVIKAGPHVTSRPSSGCSSWRSRNTYTDSCPSVALDPPVGPTVDDLASAWADLPAFNATAPTDITVDGFDGKLVEFTVPDYDRPNEDDCADGGHFMLLEGVATLQATATGPKHPTSITNCGSSTSTAPVW